MSIVLSLDASQAYSSVALGAAEPNGILAPGLPITAQGSDLILAQASSPQAASGEVLLGLVDTALKSISARPSQISEILVGIGPGSFTGIRNAVSLAQGFASGVLGAKIPVIGISSLLAVIPLQESGVDTLFTIEANTQELYAVVARVGLSQRPPFQYSFELKTGAFVLAKAQQEEFCRQPGFENQLAVYSALGSQNPETRPKGGSELPLEREGVPETVACKMLRLRSQVELSIVGDSGNEFQGLYQKNHGGRGIVPVYAKPVNARTLVERGKMPLPSEP